MHYRAEVDGLRAVAVIPVVLFHAGIAGFPGGFIGVDMFFVISGYLITGKIAADLDAGTFSFVDFFLRRARRILPILLVVIAASMVGFFFILVPSDYTTFLRSVSAALRLNSDVLFSKSGGYFDAANYPRPLLHTWSLSIEEKYYVVFPFFLWAVHRLLRPRRAAVLVVATIALFVTSLVVTYTTESKAYYLFSARIWEILAGAVLALLPANLMATMPRAARETAGWAALAVLAVGFATFGARLAYPGLYALLPVTATAALILTAGPGTSVGAILASRPFVGIGLISYGIYMWHQPIVVFAEELDLFTGAARFVILIGIVALAALTWSLIETPFRRRRFITDAPFVAVAAVAILAVIGLGREARTVLTARVARLEPLHTAERKIPEGCGLGTTDHFLPECRLTPGAHPSILLLGDSHAASLSHDLRAVAEEHGVQFRMMTAGYCLPLVTRFPANDSQTATPRCTKINTEILAEIAEKKPDLVVLSSFMYQWSARADAGRVDPDWTYAGYWTDFRRALADVARTRPVLVVGQVPIWRKWLPDLVATEIGAAATPLSAVAPRNRSDLMPGLFEFDAAYDRAVTEAGAGYVSVLDAICDAAGCPRVAPTPDGRLELTTFDYGHLAESGSHLVVRSVVWPRIEQMLPAARARGGAAKLPGAG